MLAGDTVAYDSVALIVNPIIYNAQCSNQNPWLSAAYATSCYDEYYALTKVEKIIITATEDYSAAYPSGTSLTELFDVYENGIFYDAALASNYTFRFKTPPDNGMPLHLKVQFFYEHFEQPFEATLPAIFIKK